MSIITDSQFKMSLLSAQVENAVGIKKSAIKTFAETSESKKKSYRIMYVAVVAIIIVAFVFGWTPEAGIEQRATLLALLAVGAFLLLKGLVVGIFYAVGNRLTKKAEKKDSEEQGAKVTSLPTQAQEREFASVA